MFQNVHTPKGAEDEYNVAELQRQKLQLIKGNKYKSKSS